MQVPLHVTLKRVPQPAIARGEIANAATVLERFHKRITGCRVAVACPEARHRTGALFDVRVVVKVPGHPDIVVSRRAQDQPEREHLSVSLRKAFAQARRGLQDAAREMRGDVKVNRAKSATPPAAELAFARAESRRR